MDLICKLIIINNMKIQLLLLLALTSQAANVEDDVMYQLPDCKPFQYGAYSGYLKVDDHKALHYLMVESQNNPETDPVVLWFNGGPGCSSLLGFI